MYNVPEAHSGDSSAQKAYDANIISDIVNKIQALLGINKSSGSQVIPKEKFVIKNTKKLKQCSGDFQNIYLAPDLSYVTDSAKTFHVHVFYTPSQKQL